MSMLKQLKDRELLATTKSLVQKERSITMEILRHLQEIERRKLYCDVRRRGPDASSGEASTLSYGSLFEYAVGELGYSEAAASRRIQAMHLMTEIPEVAPMIESGALNLSNVCQAQSFFRDLKKSAPERDLNKEEKKEILQKLEHKSARAGQRILLSMGGPTVLPRERERVVSEDHTEVSFVMSRELKAKLAEVRALFGPKGASLGLAELVMEMACITAERLGEKKFGKKRVCEHRSDGAQSESARADEIQIQSPTLDHSFALESGSQDVRVPKRRSPETIEKPFYLDVGVGYSSRYISAAIKHRVWQHAHGKCEVCGSQQNLQFDHVHPVALGGESTVENLKLLCRACNLRRGIKTFGATAMRRV